MSTWSPTTHGSEFNHFLFDWLPFTLQSWGWISVYWGAKHALAKRREAQWQRRMLSSTLSRSAPAKMPCRHSWQRWWCRYRTEATEMSLSLTLTNTRWRLWSQRQIRSVRTDVRLKGSLTTRAADGSEGVSKWCLLTGLGVGRRFGRSANRFLDHTSQNREMKVLFWHV